MFINKVKLFKPLINFINFIKVHHIFIWLSHVLFSWKEMIIKCKQKLTNISIINKNSFLWTKFEIQYSKTHNFIELFLFKVKN